MKIKLIEENNDFEDSSNDNPLFLLTDGGTYMIDLPLDEITYIIQREGYEIDRMAAPQTFLMDGLRESIKKRKQK